MSAWQPIETAPRDGEPVLLFSPDAANQIPTVGFYIADDETTGDWCEWWGSSPVIDAYPTHWMPLPEPPL